MSTGILKNIGMSIVLGLFVAGSTCLFAQDQAAPAKALSPAAKRGEELFKANCDVCHNADSTERKVGPGLKGVSKRATFANGDKGGPEGIEHRIETGTTTGMPSFKDRLTPAQIKDLVAYLKTL